MPKRMSDNEVDRRKTTAYQRLVSALSNETRAIKEFGAFSPEAHDADAYTARARRNYNLWQQK